MEILAVVLLGIGFLFVRMIFRDVQREERQRKRMASGSGRPRISPQRPQQSPRALPVAAAPPVAPSGAAGSWGDAFAEGVGEGLAAEIERGDDHAGQESRWGTAHAGSAVEESHPLPPLKLEHERVELDDLGPSDDVDDDADSSDSGGGWSWDDD